MVERVAGAVCTSVRTARFHDKKAEMLGGATRRSFSSGGSSVLSSATYSVKRIVPIEAGADFFFTGLGSLPRKLTRLKLLV